MSITTFTVGSQIYVLPTFKVTYSKFLHGAYDIQLIWLKWGIALEWGSIYNNRTGL
jgi:hypothetical protein